MVEDWVVLGFYVFVVKGGERELSYESEVGYRKRVIFGLFCFFFDFGSC